MKFKILMAALSVVGSMYSLAYDNPVEIQYNSGKEIAMTVTPTEDSIVIDLYPQVTTGYDFGNLKDTELKDLFLLNDSELTPILTINFSRSSCYFRNSYLNQSSTMMTLKSYAQLFKCEGKNIEIKYNTEDDEGNKIEILSLLVDSLEMNLMAQKEAVRVQYTDIPFYELELKAYDAEGIMKLNLLKKRIKSNLRN
ncbi:MAG: hypothetical protein CME65_02920 [Halobacteriovoraceae bacterium]|nr:hypothetical protein [Halobacteriovoraceae bacterium]|tara:strand:- start:474 stop:1061 length:588 start_codon:yes stop_codon:yes gene_type:complete